MHAQSYGCSLGLIFCYKSIKLNLHVWETSQVAMLNAILCFMISLFDVPEMFAIMWRNRQNFYFFGPKFFGEGPNVWQNFTNLGWHRSSNMWRSFVTVD